MIMINGGFGETHVNSILTSLNISSISKKSLKNRECEVGVHLNWGNDRKILPKATSGWNKNVSLFIKFF